MKRGFPKNAYSRMVGSWLPDKKSGFKQKIDVISIFYTILPYLTAFDSSPGQNV
jgi:hypothetical protein